MWQPNSEAVAEVMRSGEAGDIGNVDFTNGENGTVVTVYVSRSGDGMYTVHLMPMCDDDQIRVELHREKDLVVIEVLAGRYEPATCRPPRLSRHRGHSSRLQLRRPPSHRERRLE